MGREGRVGGEGWGQVGARQVRVGARWVRGGCGVSEGGSWVHLCEPSLKRIKN